MTRTDIAEAMFRKNPNTWLHFREFANRCGWAAWRTRISECRLRGMDIQNRLEKDVAGNTHSYYMWKVD